MCCRTSGLRYIFECTSCEPGQFCSGFGNILPDGNCSARYFCSQNASVAAPTDGITGDKCPVGFYCPLGSAQPIPCPPGTYTDTTLNDVCSVCPAGHYCITGSNPAPCPAGYYCTEGTGHVWQPCPVGTYSSVTGLSNETECRQCPGGYYCSQTNSTAPTGPCEAGYYCRYGSDASRPTAGVASGDAGVCPVGYYCGAMTADPEPCPSGTFSNTTGISSLSDCQPCLDGYGCETPHLEYPTGLCSPGYYCSGGSNSTTPDQESSTGGPCPPGTYCPAGSTAPVDCKPGMYNPAPQQSQCLPCSAGYYCEARATVQLDCPKGRSLFPGALYLPYLTY